jgi:hypothetical protein
LREYLSVLGAHQPHPFRVASHHEIDLFRVMQSSPSPRRFPSPRVPCGGIKTDRSIDLPIPALLFPDLLSSVLLSSVLLSLVCWFPVLACPPAISAAGPRELEQVQDRDRVQDQVQVPSGNDQGSRLVPEKSVETGVADEGAAGERQSDSPLVEGAISWTGKDVHGREVRIPARSQNQLESPRAQVLIFLLHDCPVANSYAASMTSSLGGVSRSILSMSMCSSLRLKPKNMRRTISSPAPFLSTSNTGWSRRSGQLEFPRQRSFRPVVNCFTWDASMISMPGLASAGRRQWSWICGMPCRPSWTTSRSRQPRARWLAVLFPRCRCYNASRGPIEGTGGPWPNCK